MGAHESQIRRIDIGSNCKRPSDLGDLDLGDLGLQLALELADAPHGERLLVVALGDGRARQRREVQHVVHCPCCMPAAGHSGLKEERPKRGPGNRF